MPGYGFNTGLDGHRVKPLSEADKEEIAEGLKIIYGRARERMLENVANRFSKGITQNGWAERKANEVLAAHAQLERDLDRAHNEREKLLSNVMDRAYVSGSQKFYTDMRSVVGEAAHISPNSIKTGYILADLNNGLNASERRILRQFDDRYADIIGTVSSEMATGVMNTRQAVGEALTAFADSGITGFIDRSGRHWTLENYAEMAVLTAIERSTISGYVDTMQKYDYDLAVIDGHAGSCPICEAWENVIVSVSGNDPNYPSLSDAENDGCFHPRCLHGITTYYPDISHAPAGGFRDRPRERAEESPQYTARSKQRYMERMIRKYKDRAIVAQTPLQKKQAVNKVREWENALDELIESQTEDNYMYRHRDREKPDTHSETEEKEYSFLPTDRNTITESLVNSKGYSERFDGITGITEVDQSIAKVARDILHHRTGTRFEDLALIDAKTGELIYLLDTVDKVNGVKYNQSILDAIYNAQASGREIISLHNHPNNFPPTLDDGISALMHGYKAGVVVCHDGNIYTFTPSDPSTNDITNEDCDYVHKMIEHEVLEKENLDVWLTVLENYGMLITQR